jgi:phosphatidylglycerophosphate synthase
MKCSHISPKGGSIVLSPRLFHTINHPIVVANLAKGCGAGNTSYSSPFMSPQLKPGAVCNEREQALMDTFYKYKRFFFYPLLQLFTFLRINANHLSFLQTLLCFSLFFHLTPVYLALIIFSHVFIDGLDGPLARFQKRDSLTGAFIDVINDQFCLALIIYCLTELQVISTFSGFFYVFLYTLVVVICIVRNFLKIDNLFLYRSRLVIYSIFIIDILWQINISQTTYNYLFLFFICLMLIQSINGLYRIGVKLRNQ